MVNIITIEREYGCGGGDIAQLVANRLGWKLWDQRLTEEIARLANCPKGVVEQREEKNDPLYYRLSNPSCAEVTKARSMPQSLI